MIGSSTAMRPDQGLLPALDRYDGLVYRLLRAHRSAGHRLPVILILSARYGLIPASHPIQPGGSKERLSTKAARLCMNDLAREQLDRAWWKAQDRFLIAGPLHREVFRSLAPRFPPGIPPHLAIPVESVYVEASGRTREQLRQLQDWLNARQTFGRGRLL